MSTLTPEQRERLKKGVMDTWYAGESYESAAFDVIDYFERERVSEIMARALAAEALMVDIRKGRDYWKRIAKELSNEIMGLRAHIAELEAQYAAAVSSHAEPEAPKAGTVRVRIGFWRGFAPEEPATIELEEHMREGDVPDCWITADIPLPHPVEVEGRTEASDG